MEQELTVEELIALVNSQKGDFIIRIEFGEEADSCDREAVWSGAGQHIRKDCKTALPECQYQYYGI